MLPSFLFECFDWRKEKRYTNWPDWFKGQVGIKHWRIGPAPLEWLAG
jgi:hypothetical protein